MIRMSLLFAVIAALGCQDGVPPTPTPTVVPWVAEALAALTPTPVPPRAADPTLTARPTAEYDPGEVVPYVFTVEEIAVIDDSLQWNMSVSHSELSASEIRQMCRTFSVVGWDVDASYTMAGLNGERAQYANAALVTTLESSYPPPTGMDVRESIRIHSPTLIAGYCAHKLP